MKPYAGFWRRAGAFALDYLLILGYLLGVFLVFQLMPTFLGTTQWLFADRVRAQFVAFLLVTLPVTLYFAVSESSPKQATWGKQRLRVKVAGQNGDQISLARSLIRTLIKFIPWEISHTLIWNIYLSPQTESVLINYGFVLVYLLIGLNVASLLFMRTNQTLYDMLTGTYVISSHEPEVPLHRP